MYVFVVPHADPKLCPIEHIAAALIVSLSRNHEEQEYVSFATMVERR